MNPLSSTQTVPSPSTGRLAIDCQNLVKTYNAKPPVQAVRGIDLQVEIGECFGVLGPNGAGKTTTIEILEGLLDATSGQVEILGLNWSSDATEIRQRIGVSLQETVLSDDLTVEETVGLFRSFYEKAISVEEAIASVSLQEKSKARVNKLSGGQKQRLAVACAMVSDPEILFLDEPTTGLDPTSRREVWDIINRLREQGRTVLLTTHYMDEAQRLCDRVAIFNEGQVIALGSPDQLIQSLDAQQFVQFRIADSTNPDQTIMVSQHLKEKLQQLPSVATVEVTDSLVKIACQQLHQFVPALVELLRSESLSLVELLTRAATLDDVFVQLTGRSLEDQSETSAAE